MTDLANTADIFIKAKLKESEYAALTDRELEAAERQLKGLFGSSGNNPQPLAAEINWVYLGVPTAENGGWLAIVSGEDSYQKFANYLQENELLQRLYDLDIHYLHQRYTSEMGNDHPISPPIVVARRRDSASGGW